MLLVEHTHQLSILNKEYRGGRAVQALAIDEHRHNFTSTFWAGSEPPNSSFEQVWFAGAHADIGGGNKTRTLADVPLVCMAKQAEAAGLALDWSCLPDPNELDVTAPSHDSSSGSLALDRYLLTLREIGMTKWPVKLNERLYEAIDENGKPVKTINEKIHRSAVSRFRKKAQLCTNDDNGTCTTSPYSPETLTPTGNFDFCRLQVNEHVKSLVTRTSAADWPPILCDRMLRPGSCRHKHFLLTT